jgi:hypothetical protein
MPVKINNKITVITTKQQIFSLPQRHFIEQSTDEPKKHPKSATKTRKTQVFLCVGLAAQGYYLQGTE